MKKIKIKFISGIEREYICKDFRYLKDKMNLVLINGNKQILNNNTLYSVEIVNDFETSVVESDVLNCLRRHKNVDGGTLTHILSLCMRKPTKLTTKFNINDDIIYDTLDILNVENERIISFKIAKEDNAIIVMSFEIATTQIGDYFYPFLCKIKEEMEKGHYTYMFF